MLAINITKEELPTDDLQTIELLLSRSLHNPPKLEDLWRLMDSVWDEIGCDNKNYNKDKIAQFYNHPVWLLNGLFIEQDDFSMQHRQAISDWIAKKNLNRILDYGGGFGTLARIIAGKDSTISIDIYEPYPNEFAISRNSNYANIHFVSSLDKNYDCIVSIDVLEHVPDPLQVLATMIESVEEDGYLIIANNFYPLIKCHLPATFHFRYAFHTFARLMGLEHLGQCKESHAFIYHKRELKPFSWRKIRMYERISQIMFPFIKMIHSVHQISKR